MGTETSIENADDEKTQEIFQLEQKLEQAVQHVTKIGSIATLATRSGIARTSLNSMMESGKMRASDQNRIAQALGFVLPLIEWRDSKVDKKTPEGERRDSAARFIDFLQYGPLLTMQAENPLCPAGKFASFRIHDPGMQLNNRPSDQFVLLDEWDSDPSVVGDGIVVGLRSFDLEFELPSRPEALLADFKPRQRGPVSVEARGNAKQRYFRYTTTAPPMNKRWRPDDELARYVGAKAGDKIAVAMTASLDQSFVDFHGAEFNSNRRKKVAGHLAKLQAQGAPRVDGQVTLATQTLFIKERS